MTTHAQLTFLASSDARLFHEYVALRRRVFRNCYPSLFEDFGQPDDVDRVSFFAYALHDETLCGGARLTISTPACPRLMPLEHERSIHESRVAQDLGAVPESFGEISRMAVDDAHNRGFEISCGLGRELCAVAARHGVDVLFSICPAGPARLNRRNSVHCGVKFLIVQPWPNPFGIPMWLCAYTGVLQAYGSAPLEVPCFA